MLIVAVRFPTEISVVLSALGNHNRVLVFKKCHSMSQLCLCCLIDWLNDWLIDWLIDSCNYMSTLSVAICKDVVFRCVVLDILGKQCFISVLKDGLESNIAVTSAIGDFRCLYKMFLVAICKSTTYSSRLLSIFANVYILLSTMRVIECIISCHFWLTEVIQIRSILRQLRWFVQVVSFLALLEMLLLAYTYYFNWPVNAH